VSYERSDVIDSIPIYYIIVDGTLGNQKSVRARIIEEPDAALRT